MKRRQFLLAIPALVAAQPALGQAERMRRIGVLVMSAQNAALGPPFLKRLAELGWVEGRNLAVEMRVADNSLDRLPGLALELASLNLDVIVAASTPAARAAKDATKTIPVVFAWVADPVASGLIASLSHPGGNLTGLSNAIFSVAPKQIELLRAMVPKLRRVAELGHPGYDKAATGTGQSPLSKAAASVNITLVRVVATTAAELDSAFAAAARERVGAMVVPPMPLYGAQGKRIAELAKRYRIPVAAQARGFVADGALVSYGPDIREAFLRTAAYVDKILRGAKPADLPVEQVDRFQTVINLRTARELGLAIPQSVLLRADEVIE